MKYCRIFKVDIVKKQRKATEKGLQKVLKSFQRKKYGCKYSCKRYKNFPKYEKKSLVDYRKKYKIWKNKNALQ